MKDKFYIIQLSCVVVRAASVQINCLDLLLSDIINHSSLADRLSRDFFTTKLENTAQIEDRGPINPAAVPCDVPVEH